MLCTCGKQLQEGGQELSDWLCVLLACRCMDTHMLQPLAHSCRSGRRSQALSPVVHVNAALCGPRRPLASSRWRELCLQVPCLDTAACRSVTEEVPLLPCAPVCSSSQVNLASCVPQTLEPSHVHEAALQSTASQRTLSTVHRGGPVPSLDPSLCCACLATPLPGCFGTYWSEVARAPDVHARHF